MADTAPRDRKKLRACMLCGLIKGQSDFRRDGCNNCEDVLRFKNNSERMMECTSANFDGMVAMMKPDASWVARWQRIDKFHKGIYAIRISGRLPADIEGSLRDDNIIYRPRDGSVRD
eukprot:jgi/Hompol1/3864/HPOL_003395-RA